MGRTAGPVALAALLLLARSMAAAPAPAPQFLIAPGRGIGPVTVAMHSAQANAAMGTPKATRTDSAGHVWFMWFDGGDAAETQLGGLYAVVGNAGQILRIVVRYDPRYATANGLRTGVTEQAVVAAMGQPSSVDPLPRTGHRLMYAARGISFAVIDNPAVRGYRTVSEIAVFRAE